MLEAMSCIQQQFNEELMLPHSMHVAKFIRAIVAEAYYYFMKLFLFWFGHVWIILLVNDLVTIKVFRIVLFGKFLLICSVVLLKKLLILLTLPLMIILLLGCSIQWMFSSFPCCFFDSKLFYKQNFKLINFVFDFISYLLIGIPTFFSVL